MKNVKIVTFNLRTVWKGDADGHNSFVFRAGLIYEKVMEEAPDVIAFQEVREAHLVLLQRMLPEYDFYGQGRLSEYNGEGLYTAVKKDSCSLIGQDCFWISPTPYVPASRYENQSDYPRICLITEVRHKESGKRFSVYNIHLDHISDEARVLGIRCVFDQMRILNEKKQYPVILLGDFNARPESETIRYCNEEVTPAMTDVTQNLPITFHNFGKEAAKIDYIYVEKTILGAVRSVGIWDTEEYGIYLSDHYPVFMDLDVSTNGIC